MTENFGAREYSDRGRSHSKRDADEREPATPFSPRWRPPEVSREPIPTAALRSVLAALDRPHTAMDGASSLGVPYGAAFVALELLAQMGYVERLTNGRYAVRHARSETA